jgi:N-acetylglucosamine kinase-like BadF-type ATPase
MRYFLGVDIGGTKSHALTADEIGNAVGFGASGAGNYEDVGWEGLREALHTVTREALADAGIEKGDLAGAGFGIAGYDWPGEREPTLQAIASLGLAAPCELVNDAVIALMAGASEGWGVVVVAGTSNNCRGRDRQGREGRVTGCGPVFAEYGGAGEIVAKAIQAVALHWTRRGPATRLSKAFVDQTGATGMADLLEGLVLRRYHLSADVAPMVFQVANEGDEVAREIIHWAGRELGSLAIGVIRQLGFHDLSFEVVLSGSLYNGNPALIESMRSTIHGIAPGARLVRLTVPPVAGGVLLGMEQAGIPAASLRPRLIESMQKCTSLPKAGVP